jgi:hypothetical protein
VNENDKQSNDLSSAGGRGPGVGVGGGLPIAAVPPGAVAQENRCIAYAVVCQVPYEAS